MCGIIGVIGKQEISPLILKAMGNLEYRGYDSAGMAVINNHHIDIRKGIGKLADVESQHHLSQLRGNIGIGHVRWATHGGVTVDNAHPHCDCKKKIAIVHNGIIENYRELRAQVEPKHKFVSQTDTEVVVHLIEELMNNNFSLAEALHAIALQLKGSYALLAICLDEPGQIAAIRKDSPLVAGIGQAKFIASDAFCFADETDQAIYIEDGETVVLNDVGIRIFDSDFKEIDRHWL